LTQRRHLLRRLVTSLHIKSEPELERAYAINWEIKPGDVLSITKMSSATAHQLAIERLGYRPPHNRNNATRHQCATFTFAHYTQTQVDVILGHHVDGHAPNSRYASSTAFDKKLTLICLADNAKRFGFLNTCKEGNH